MVPLSCRMQGEVVLELSTLGGSPQEMMLNSGGAGADHEIIHLRAVSQGKQQVQRSRGRNLLATSYTQARPNVFTGGHWRNRFKGQMSQDQLQKVDFCFWPS